MPEILTPEQVQAIREEASKATEGSWAWDSRGDKCSDVQVGIAADEWGIQVGGFIKETDKVVYIGSVADVHGGNEHADAAFIASARTNVPALCNTIDALRQRIKELEGRRCGNCRHSIALASAYVMCRGRGRKGIGDMCEIWEASNNE